MKYLKLTWQTLLNGRNWPSRTQSIFWNTYAVCLFLSPFFIFLGHFMAATQNEFYIWTGLLGVGLAGGSIVGLFIAPYRYVLSALVIVYMGLHIVVFFVAYVVLVVPIMFWQQIG